MKKSESITLNDLIAFFKSVIVEPKTIQDFESVKVQEVPLMESMLAMNTMTTTKTIDPEKDMKKRYAKWL